MELKLGQVVMTAAVNNLIADDIGFAKHVTHSFDRYRTKDWGDLAEDDRKMNDGALRTGEDRILAAYKHPTHPEWRIWIITEWDRSYTTILFPSDY